MEPSQPISTIISIEVGAIVSSFLFGIVTLQAFIYFSRYRDDHRSLKALASAVWLFELGHMIYIARLAHTTTISTCRIQQTTPSAPDVSTVMLLTGSTHSLVQAFYTGRVRRFTMQLWLPVILWLLICLTMIAMVAGFVASYDQRFEWFVHRRGWAPAVIWVSAAVTDTVTACVLSWCLIRHRKSVLQRSRRVLDKIMLMTLSTGALTSVLGVVITVCFLVFPAELIYLGPYFCLARAYTNSFFGCLIARNSFRRDTMKTISLQFFDEQSDESTDPPLDGSFPQP